MVEGQTAEPGGRRHGKEKGRRRHQQAQPYNGAKEGKDRLRRGRYRLALWQLGGHECTLSRVLQEGCPLLACAALVIDAEQAAAKFSSKAGSLRVRAAEAAQ